MASIFVLVALVGAVYEPVDWGPLTLHSRAPVYDNQLSYTAGRIQPVPAGRWEANVSASYVNTWGQMPAYFFDGEWARLALRVAYGFGDGWEANVDWALIERSGGFMDGFIEGFHRAFGVTQARRDLFPRNQLSVLTIDQRGTIAQLSNADAGVGTSNPVLAVKKRLTTGGSWPTLVADGAVKLPVGTFGNAFGSGGVQILVDMGLQQPFAEHFQVYGAVGLVLSPGFNVVYGMQTSEVQKFISVAFEWRVASDVTVVLQYLNQDGAVEKCLYAPLNSTTHEFALGSKWAPLGGDTFVLEGGIMENTVHDANTPDFGFMVAARWRTPH